MRPQDGSILTLFGNHLLMAINVLCSSYSNVNCLKIVSIAMLIFHRNFITKCNYFSLVPRSPPFLFLQFAFSIIHQRTKNRGGLGMRPTRKCHCHQKIWLLTVSRSEWLLVSDFPATAQSLTPRSSDSPGSVAPCEWLLPTVEKRIDTRRCKELVHSRMFNFAHTEYYKGKSLSQHYTLSNQRDWGMNT